MQKDLPWLQLIQIIPQLKLSLIEYSMYGLKF